MNNPATMNRQEVSHLAANPRVGDFGVAVSSTLAGNRFLRCLCLIGAFSLLSTYTSASNVCNTPEPIAQASKQKQPAARLSELGRSYESSRQFACAAEAFARASALEPGSPTLAYHWGSNLHAASKDVEAQEPLYRSRMLNPRDIQIPLTLGAVLEKLGHGQEAEKQWREALTIDPGSSTALNALSMNLIVRHDYTGVIALLDKKSPTADRSTEQILALGTSLAAVARLEDAKQTLQEGLTAYPDRLPIAHQLAMVLLIMDQPIEASHIFELALQKHPYDRKTETMYLKALALSRSEHAPDQARKVLALYPNDWQVLYLCAVLEDRDEKFSDARSHLERSIALNTTYAPAHAALGKVLDELGDLGKTKLEREKAETLGDREPDVEYELARVLRSLGQKESAKDKFNEVQQQKVEGMNESRSAVFTAQGDRSITNSLERSTCLTTRQTNVENSFVPSS
jgi:Flp pilus assembly protein TadD